MTNEIDTRLNTFAYSFFTSLDITSFTKVTENGEYGLVLVELLPAKTFPDPLCNAPSSKPHRASTVPTSQDLNVQ